MSNENRSDQPGTAPHDRIDNIMKYNALIEARISALENLPTTKVAEKINKLGEERKTIYKKIGILNSALSSVSWDDSFEKVILEQVEYLQGLDSQLVFRTLGLRDAVTILQEEYAKQ